MISGIRSSLANAFRRAALPLGWYYAVTIALPLANGAAQSSGFVKHGLIVLLVPPVAIALACAACTVTHALARSLKHRRKQLLDRTQLGGIVIRW